MPSKNSHRKSLIVSVCNYFLMTVMLVSLFFIPNMVSRAYAEKRDYSLHLSSFKHLSDAVEEIKQLKRSGHDAFCSYETVNGKGKWYRVYIGKFAYKEEARKVGSELKEKRLVSYFMPVSIDRDVTLSQKDLSPEKDKAKHLVSTDQKKKNKEIKLAQSTVVTQGKVVGVPAKSQHNASCQESAYLKEGISQYRQENYEEAIEILKKARKEDLKSSTAAFFLGMAYKQILDYHKALTHLKDAVTLTPQIKEAVVELIDVLHQLGNIEEAKRWIEVAEKENILPAKIAFLKGLICKGEGKNLEAIESFEKAKSLDKALVQSAEFHIALCYLKEKELKKAKERFKAAVLYDPLSDLANFARQYQDIVEKRIFLERPLHLTVGLYGQYDTNMVLNPIESEAATGITDEESLAMLSTIRLDYMPALKGPWLFNAWYSFYSNLHQKHSHTHDLIGNTVSIAPGYTFGKFALNLVTTYSNFLVRGPSYKRYMDYLSTGPLFRVLPSQNHILEVFTGYNIYEYFQPPSMPEEERDSEGLNMYINWIWLYKDGGFFNLKYEFIREDTEGINWENKGSKFILNATIPLIDKLKLQLNGEVFLKDYRHTHSVYNIEREDVTYTLSAGFNWEISKNIDLIARYTGIRCDSNLAVYDYKRNLYTAGIEFRY